jgi:hypothetical protein
VSRVALAAIALAGCSEHGTVPADATFVPGPITYQLQVGWAEPRDRTRPSMLPVVFIDGIARSAVTEIYAHREDTLHRTHVVELRAGDAVLRTRTVEIDQACLDQVEPSENSTDVLEGTCAYWSGDLRTGGVQVSSDRGFCIGEGMCSAECGGPFSFSNCPDGQRCSSRATSTAPFASHLACAPIGPKQRGEACALIADPKGAYDDCGKDLLCVGGTCQTVCSPVACMNTSTGCQYVPGQPPELQLFCPGQ